MDIIELPGPPVIYEIWKALFTGAPKKAVNINGVHYPIRKFGGKQGNLPGIDYGNTRVVVQNPNTLSKWATMARNGAQIAWAIRTKGEGNKWVGRIVNGRCYKHDGFRWVEVTWEGHKEAPK